MADQLINRLTADDLLEKIDKQEDLLLIDPLPDQHFEKIHLPKAQNACVYKVTFLQDVKALNGDKTKAVILYGYSQNTREGSVAAEKLLRSGYQNVSLLEGGLTAWRERGLPLEGTTSEVPPEETESVALPDGTYRVDTEQSRIEWTGRNPNSKHFGTAPLAEGHLEISAGTVSGSFAIDMTSIDNIDLKGDELHPVLMGHLHSDDFFFTKMFPTARYLFDALAPAEERQLGLPNYIVSGRLELRGISAQLNFPATISRDERGGLKAEAHFDIDRTKWGVNYGSARYFKHLGMHLVFDPISIQIHLVATKTNLH